MVAESLVPGQLPEANVLLGDVNGFAVDRILVVAVGRELEGQVFAGGQLVGAEGFPAVGIDAFAVDLIAAPVQVFVSV